MKHSFFVATVFLLNSFCQAQTLIHKDTLAIRELRKRLSVFLTEQKYDSIIACQSHLKVLYTKHKRWNEVLKSQLEIGSNEIQRTSLENARVAIEEGFALTNRYAPGNNYFLSEFYNLYGILYYELGDYEKAINYLKQSLAIQLKIITTRNLSDLAVRYNNIGAIISRMGDYDEAIYYYTKGLELRKSLADDLQVGESYNNLSVSYYRKKLFRKALEYQLQYLKILNKQNSGNVANDFILCYNSLGIYYFELQEYDKALAFLHKALSLNQTSEYLIEKTFHNLGYVYRMAGNADKALYFLNQAVSKSAKKYNGRHPDIGKAYRHIGVIHVQNYDMEKGLHYYQKALMQLVDNFTDSSILANPKLIDVKSKPDLLRTLRDKAVALRIFGKEKKDLRFINASLTTSQLAINLIEQMRNDYESETTRQFINEEALPVYEDALETIFQLQGIAKSPSKLVEAAFRVIEKGKALLLIESLQRKKNAFSFGVPDSLLIRQRRIQTSIAYYERQLTLAKSKKDSLQTELASGYLEQYKDDAHKLQDKFKKHYPRYFRSRNSFSIASLPSVQRFLKNKKAIMAEYFVGADKIWICIISPDEIQFIQKSKPYDFHRWLMQYQRSLVDYNFITDSSTLCYQYYSNSAYNLFQTLLTDFYLVKKRSQCQRLIIVPHNELAYMPFESLLLKPAPKEFSGYKNLSYALREIEISYSYSASLHLELNSDHNNRSDRCIAFGPEFNSSQQAQRGLSALPHVKTELEAIQNVLDGDFLYGTAATKRVFKERSGEYGVLHLATHSVMDEHDPANSRIYFSDQGSGDSVLFAYEIANLSLNANLVVLSSCETGSGKLAKGEGVMSIGRGFMYAGASGVIMNFWRSEDQANAFLMSEFYAALGLGKSKSSSLRHAKLKYLQNADEFKSHPAFWAGYVLLGNDDKIDGKNYVLSYLVFVAIPFVLVFVFFLFFKKRNVFSIDLYKSSKTGI